ncbi:Putative Protein AGE2 [Rhizopus microsporus]|nr:Putative Protein AGE2 [Rhizopus microsporus]
MSTRLERLANKEANEKHAKILTELLQKAHNKHCADCRRKDPRWASWNLGIFICIRCSGIHRSLGTHISKVKSIDLDTWAPDQIESMVHWGNQRANAYWEANLGDRQPEDQLMDKWIRAKYEQKKWVESKQVPDPSIIKVNDTNVDTEMKQTERVEKRNSMRLDYDHYNKTNYTQDKRASLNIGSNVSSSSTAKADPFSATLIPSPKPATSNNSSNKGDKPFKVDMAAFQEQLSKLALGRPSTGLIPRAPEGSEKAWANIIMSSRESTTTSKDY